MKNAVGLINFLACETRQCDLAWLVDIGKAPGDEIDIQFFWKRDIAVGPDPFACASCYWRAHYLQEKNKARGLHNSPTMLWADRAGGVGADQPPPGAPFPEEKWDE